MSVKQTKKYSGRKKKSGNRKQQGGINQAEYEGVLSMTREGYAFLAVQVKEGQKPVEDVFIPARKLNGALHGDLVRVAVYAAKNRQDKKLERQVLFIKERSSRPYVGILQIVDKQAYVITESKNMPYDIHVQKGTLSGARNGQKVAALVTDWDKRGNFPIGRITDVLGTPGENQTEMHAILAEFGLPYRFDKKVEDLANELRDTILPEDIQGRRDFRKIPSFTIDPADAKDFDDALSYRKTGKGKVLTEVGVHIADVSHYVDSGSLLDKAAYERGNSVYLVDRTVPMFPEKLSNQLCSLRPHEDKLCVSAVFEFDENFNVVSRWFGRTVIRSDCRLSYEQAQAVLDAGEGNQVAADVKIPPEVCESLVFLHRQASRLREERMRSGAVDFDKAEVKVQVDEQGVPVDIRVREQLDSHRLIEEFMLLANREVTEFVQKKKNKQTGKPPAFVYRIHESPDEDKMEAFRNFVHHFGYQMKQVNSPRDYARELNTLLNKTKEKAEAGGIVIMALRSMPRAHYSTKNAGHFGLAFSNYTHFTSPIRRYSDLMVHRLLLHYISGGKEVPVGQMENQCIHLSQREQLATEAERASIKYKMVEFMQDKIGKEFEGVITGITEWGMFVELDKTMIEGMVSVRDMTDDYYVYDKDVMTLTGTHSGKHFALGQKVRIAVTRANMEQKQLDFELIQ